MDIAACMVVIVVRFARNLPWHIWILRWHDFVLSPLIPLSSLVSHGMSGYWVEMILLCLPIWGRCWINFLMMLIMMRFAINQSNQIKIHEYLPYNNHGRRSESNHLLHGPLIGFISFLNAIESVQIIFISISLFAISYQKNNGSDSIKSIMKITFLK